MGGEQYAVLMYGPKEYHTVAEWIQKFNLVNKNDWVKNFIEEGNHNYGTLSENEDQEGIDIIFQQEFEEEFNMGFKILYKFLNKHNLSVCFDNNICWEYLYIGSVVENYPVKVQVLNDLPSFCKKYNLQEPTLFAGIQGELE